MVYSPRRDIGDLTWRTVNVVYYYYDKDNSSTNIVATLDPSLSEVTGVTEEQHTGRLGTATSTVDSGYTFWTAATQQTNPVYEADSRWTVPYAHEPYNTACSYTPCDYTPWAGLTTDYNGANYIVQAGTDSGVYCAFGGCSEFYQSVYEFKPQPVQYCGGVRSGDHVEADVYNDAILGGSSGNWDVYLFDYGTSGPPGGQTLCAVSGYGFGVPTPYYAQFIGERACKCQGFTRLPNFGSVTMTTGINTRNGGITGYTPYSNGWDYQIFMNNGCSDGTDNISTSNVATDGTFTLTYENSCNT